MIESCQRVQMTSLTLLKMFFVAKTTYWSWYASILKTCKSPLIFVNEGAKINLNFYIKKILTPALVEMKKHFGKKNLHFNKMVPPLTPQTNVKSGVKVTFHHLGVRKCGLLHLLILMDYYNWSIFEKEACSTTHKNLEDFKVSLFLEIHLVLWLESFRG